MNTILRAIISILWLPVSLHSAYAEIIPTEDLDSLSASSENDEGQGFNSIQPEISVGVGSGKSTLPYSPPGLGSYQNGMRYTSFQFAMYRKASIEPAPVLPFYHLRLKNSFPASGRNYDLQAVSWFDLSFLLGLEKEFQSGVQQKLRFHAALEALYERFHYPNGTLAFYGLPLRLGTAFQTEIQLNENPISVGLSAEYAVLAFARTAVKYQPLPVSRAVGANRVRFEPNEKVLGNGLVASLDFAFSGKQWREIPEYGNNKHKLSFVWESKIRSAAKISTEFTSEGEVQGTSSLDLEEHSYGLRWSERL